MADQEVRHLHYNSNPDSLDIGTPSKGGSIKLYGDFSDEEGFRKKIDAAVELRKYAQTKMEL